ncbi:uncharacterized protein KZ484_024416 [Pholidichthys leucotaenia]
MRPVVLWVLLAVLVQQTLVSSHILGRPPTTGDLAQLKSLLERIEESLAEAAQEEDTESDYAETSQEPERSHATRGWSQDQEGYQEPLVSDRTQLLTEGHSRAASQRSRLQDLLMATRKRASGCFGARMDRIGNASGLGCNNGRGRVDSMSQAHRVSANNGGFAPGGPSVDEQWAAHFIQDYVSKALASCSPKRVLQNVEAAVRIVEAHPGLRKNSEFTELLTTISTLQLSFRGLVIGSLPALSEPTKKRFLIPPASRSYPAASHRKNSSTSQPAAPPLLHQRITAAASS